MATLGRIELSRGMDVESLERALSVRRRARADGQAERPQSNHAEWSAVERDIDAAIAAEAARLAELERIVGDTLDRSLTSRPAPGAAVDGAAAASGAQLTLHLEEGRIAPAIQAARNRAERAARDLQDFRKRNGLQHEPVYPESRLLAIGLLLAAAVFEAVFSATLFVHDADGGYAEAAAVAMGLGGSNVLLGVLAGYIGLRYWRAKHVGLKAAGAAALLAFGGLAIGLNLFAAHYRETLAKANDDMPPTLRLASSDFLGLITPEAVVLLMIGVGVWMFSATKGYAGLDDPYPDYGKLDRMRAHTEHAYAELRDSAIEDLNAPILAAQAAIEDDLASQRAHVAKLRRAYDEAGVHCQAIEACRRRLDAIEANLIAIYWEENRAARTTPPPERAPRARPATPSPLAKAGDVIAAADRELQALQKAAAEARAALQSLHDQSQARVFGRAA